MSGLQMFQNLSLYGSLAEIDSVEKLNEAMDKLTAAQEKFREYTQEQVDKIFKAVALTASQNRVAFAKYAYEETQKGVFEDKVIKNEFAADYIYHKYCNDKTAGVIEYDEANGLMEIAEPVGPVVGIAPVTNPTSTIIYKTLIALKTRNCIIFSPHPGAHKASVFVVKVLHEAAVKAGAPENCVQIIYPDMKITTELLHHEKTRFIWATGGPGLVHASYTSGKPALGGGPGNAPALVDETCDLNEAVGSIVVSKTFDCGMICATENAVVVVESVYENFVAAMKKRGCYFMTPEETKKVSSVLFGEGMRLNAKAVGQTAKTLASMAGFEVPENTVVLCGEATEVKFEEPMAHEKLTTILGIYVAKDFDDGVRLCKELVTFGGKGHTAVLYTNQNNKDRIAKYQNEVPAFHILVDMPSSLGCIGDMYNFRLAPALTITCGTMGGGSSSDNIGPKHLLNIKRVGMRRENMLWLKVPKAVYFKRSILKEALSDLRGTHKRAIIITDRTMTMLGQTDKIIKACEGHGMVCAVYDKVVPDPTIKCIMEGVAEMNVFKPDLCIALGGGSAMDAAKMMRLFYEYPDQDLQDIATRFVDIRKRVVGCPPLGKLIKSLVCIPTTSGTGAEVTPFAVVTSEEGRKYPLVDYELTPDMAIVDPEFAVGMPKRLTSWTGIDALTHAIESYVSIMATDFTRPYSLRSIQLIFESLALAYNNGKDIEAREKMHNASAIAGIAFANAFLGCCHSVAHQLGSVYHIPHGLANALMLSHIIKYNATDSPVKMGTFPQYKYPQAMRHYAEIAELLLPPTQVVKMTDVDKVQYLIDRVEQLKADVGIPKSIKESGMVTEEEFFAKVDQVAIMAFDDQCTGANPRYPLVSELKQLMIDAWNGTPIKMN